MKNKLFVLISTMDSRILNLKSILCPYEKNIHYVISHQITQDKGQDILDFIDILRKRKDVQYSTLEGKGVAKNRNNTLKFIEPSSVCLVLDDDVVLCRNAFKMVSKSFDENPPADFISFKILDLEDQDYKPYPKAKQWHTLQTLTGIGTTEMAFRSDFILHNNVRFDERFGPGAENYPIGEDFIFAMDLYHLKTKMLFLPIPIVKHLRGSTGMNLDQKVIFGRGAMFARVFGWKAFFIDFLFSIKKYPTYRKEISFVAYLLFLIKGTNSYFTSPVKRASCKN